MSAESPAVEADQEKKPAKKPGRMKRLAASPGNMSAAGCASILTALFLVCLVLVVWLVYWLDPNNIPWRHSMSWTRIFIEVVLVIAIPFVLYRAIRLWMQGDKSRFPDIDYAWKAGLEALQRNGLHLRGEPLFLVLGSAGPRQERALVRAAAISLRVQNVPEGPAPLHWYASPDGIYLFCTEASWTSALAALIDKRREEAAAAGVNVAEAALPARRLEATARIAPTPQAAATPGMGTGRGTIMLDQFVADRQSQAAAEGKTEASDEVEEREVVDSVVPASSAQPAVLARQDSAEQTQRLAYVCQLLRQQRSPLCPTNGVLTLLPYEVFQASPRETQEMQRAIRSDLSTMQLELHSRFPVTALVVGMQNERGFREIIRRVGRERSLGQRFGRRFDMRLIATADQMAALCIHVSGVFEDWIHTLFREAEALSRPGNTRLYSLLCKIRCNLAPVLKDVLSGGFGYDTQQKTLDEPIAFSGCYFAATGETEDQQAFVRGVFEKLGEEQEEVEWTRRAKKSNRRYQTFAVVATVVGSLLLVAIVATIVYRIAT